MSVSERYRDLYMDVDNLRAKFAGALGESKEVQQIEKAVEKLAELKELVGEIPRIRLESQLTPVLLKAHNYLDRGRVFFEEEGDEDRAGEIWDVEQKIYRLLNDL